MKTLSEQTTLGGQPKRGLPHYFPFDFDIYLNLVLITSSSMVILQLVLWASDINNLFFNQNCPGYNATPTIRLVIFTPARNPVAIFELGQIYFYTNPHKYKKKRDMTSAHKKLYGGAGVAVSHKRSSCTPLAYLQFPFPQSLVFGPHVACCVKRSMGRTAGVHTRQNCVIGGMFYLSLLRSRAL